MPHVPKGSAVADSCPAFADGCPYAHDNSVLEWVKAKRLDAISACPAFKSGCPFNEVKDMDSLCKELQKLPQSHARPQQTVDAGNSLAHGALVEMLQAVHQASQHVKETVGGDCPVFQKACPFKNCMTSSGTPLVLELETRSWGLIIQHADIVGEGGGSKRTGEPQAEEVEEGLAVKLKVGTKDAHKEAETVHFVREFIKGRVPREIYAQFVVNLYHVYKALEESLDVCANHDLVDPLYFPDELRRVPSLREDAEFFCGPDWERQTAPSVATREYAERLREIARGSPELLVPHAYTRYLGDLSGGQVLRRAAVRGLNLPDDGSGVSFYRFRRIPDAKVFKNMYRARLDSLSANKATADLMVVEANRAFNFNTRIFRELDALGGYFEEVHEVSTMEPAPQPSTESLQLGTSPGTSACPFAALAASGAPMPEGHPLLSHKAGGAATELRLSKAVDSRLRLDQRAAVVLAALAVVVISWLAKQFW